MTIDYLSDSQRTGTVLDARPASQPHRELDQALLDDAALERLLTTRGIRSVYQPIVDLYTGAVRGYEALARGPKGDRLERPDRLFATARRSGRLAELDSECRTAAIEGASAAGMFAPWTLFVNIEPEVAAHALRSADIDTWPDFNPKDRSGPLRIVMELTERALTADPLQLLRLVDRIRARGWGIALDDVGADPNSLALLPLLRPDVIKLDLRLVQQRPTSDIAAIVSAVNAEAERSGTVVLAEGIETQEHLHVALALGATLGQGWLLGRPEPLPASLVAFTDQPIPIVTHPQPSDRTPFALGTAHHARRIAGKRLLIEISKHLERQAMRSGDSTVVLATFQSAEFFTPATRRRYADLAANAAFVGALGEGMPLQPQPGVRGGHLEPTDPLRGEWDIAVVGPHYAATLIARDLGDDVADADRRFEFVLSHDRELAISVAGCLMSRIAAAPQNNSAAHS